jgi:radical SAM protein with 4Fe4S-binding SPASM domain
MLRVCLVKQCTTYDLFTRTGPDLRSIVASSNWRSGPIGLWEAFDTTARIVCEDNAGECRLGQGHWGRYIDGWDVWPEGSVAEEADTVDWDAYDIVISIDVAVPSRIIARHPRVMWCYYFIEGGPTGIDGAFRGSPFFGYNVFLNHRLARSRLSAASPSVLQMRSTRRAVLDFPYYLQSATSVRRLYPELADAPRAGICLSHHSREVCGPAERAALAEFGPVRTEWATIADIHRAELVSRYYVVHPDSMRRAGLGLIEAVSAGCLALVPSNRLWGFPELVLPELDFTTFDELLGLLRRLEADETLAGCCRAAQQEMVQLWCYDNPTENLETMLCAFRQSRATPYRQRRAEARAQLGVAARRTALGAARWLARKIEAAPGRPSPVADTSVIEGSGSRNGAAYAARPAKSWLSSLSHQGVAHRLGVVMLEKTAAEADSATAKRNPSLRLSWMGRARWEQLQLLPARLSVHYVNPERPLRVPREIQIEATSKCNLRCPFCSHSRDKSSGHHLTVEGLRGIIDWLPLLPARVRLSGVGEPLLNPDFFSLVDVLSDRGIKCDFITNGTLLTPSVREAILSRPAIDGVVISCDGAQQTTFESYRLGAHFESWKQRVGELLAEAKELRGESLGFTMSTVINRPMLSELPDVIRLAADLGFPRITFLAPVPLDDVAASLCPTPAEMSAIPRDELLDMAAAMGIETQGLALHSWPMPLVRMRRRVGLGRCMQPWEYLFVRANGDVASCCALFDSDKAAVMGNVFQESFTDVWRGGPFREFRRTLVSKTNPLCNVCQSAAREA